MSNKVYVSGHRNPDSDSICSAICYAYLLNELKKYDAIPVRIGNVSKETAFILNYFSMDIPEFLEDVKSVDGDQKSVVLVDHNERGQSIPGIEDALILEVIDHHRIADFQTAGPVYFRAEPVGCTATIITKLFRENNISIPKNIAGLLLGAIVSDSLLFKSPTCTQQDKDIAMELVDICGVDVEVFGLEMLKAGSSLVGMSIDEIYNQDYKEFSMDSCVVGVGQVNTMDIEGFMPYKKDMLEYMKSKVDSNNLSVSMLLLTDVLNASSEVLIVGPDANVVGSAFGIELVDQQATLPGVISRKKQVVPVLTETFK